ncbi:MAG: hypothetical protein KDD52_03070 [Bdellovibrionales bacterium]|nr:hypothetical protein [Bdellovibrionales bacterium]
MMGFRNISFSKKSSHTTFQTFFFILFLLALCFIESCSKSGSRDAKIKNAEKLWGEGIECLKCHPAQHPIALGHTYPCDTCHHGNPWSKNKEEAHYQLIRAPQNPEYISMSCDKCHRRILGSDVPYNADFIKDTIVNHKKELQELDWRE